MDNSTYNDHDDCAHNLSNMKRHNKKQVDTIKILPCAFHQLHSRVFILSGACYVILLNQLSQFVRKISCVCVCPKRGIYAANIILSLFLSKNSFVNVLFLLSNQLGFFYWWPLTKSILEIWDVERLTWIFNDWQFAIKNIKYQMSNFITFRIWKRYKNLSVWRITRTSDISHTIFVPTLRILKNHKFEQVGN